MHAAQKPPCHLAPKCLSCHFNVPLRSPLKTFSHVESHFILFTKFHLFKCFFGLEKKSLNLKRFQTSMRFRCVGEQLPTASYLLMLIAILSTRKQSHVHFLPQIFNLGQQCQKGIIRQLMIQLKLCYSYSSFKSFKLLNIPLGNIFSSFPNADL